MTDYEPVDLAPFCNAGETVLAPRPKRGEQLLRGLPFQVADDPDRCLLLPTQERQRIEVGRPARRVLFAHRQLEGPDSSFDALGATVAEYRFELAGGQQVSVPIRQRFEIQVVPAPWGQNPFLALPDGYDQLWNRTEGPWGAAGERQCESIQAWPERYWLWAWENPYPDQVLDAIVVCRRDHPLVIAAITLGQSDELPFVRTARRPVLLGVTGDAVAARDLHVEVDRGMATYVQQLAGGTGEEIAGWGREAALTETSTAQAGEQAYVEVAALPSATVVLKQGEVALGQTSWGRLEHDGSVADGPVRFRLADPGRNWVHVRVLDDTTGRPVPCRVHFRSPEGVPFQPHGHHDHVNSNLGTWHVDVGGDVRLGDVTYAYIDGTCQGWLPRGDVRVEVSRGFEYTPLQETVRIEPGQRELTLRIARWTDLAAQGWYSGDSHVHFLSTQGAHLEQQGEDLRVVNLLQSQWGSLFTNTEEFTGHVSRSADGGYLTYVGQENRQHVLGHLTLWGLKEPVMPWCSDGPSEAEIGGSLESTLSDWADRAHGQGGTVIIPHFPNPNGEPAVLATTGRADAVESLSWQPDAENVYYQYLNAGYRLPLVGGTDKMSSGVPVGLYRTYAHLDGEFSYEAWCAAVRAGQTFLSGGPVIGLRVDGRPIGDTLALGGPGTVHVEAWAESIFPLERLEVVVGGQVVARAEGGGRLLVEDSVRIDRDTWVVARCRGTGGHLDDWRRPVFAHTSPVYVATQPEWAARDERTAQYLLTLVEGGLAYVRQHAAYHAQGTVTHHHRHHDHQAYIEAPFQEALAALRARYPSL